MKKFLLMASLISYSVLAEDSQDLNQEINNNSALAVYASSFTPRCLHSKLLPSYHFATNVGLLFLEHVAKERQMIEARKAQKLLDTEVLKNAQKEKSPIGNDGDYQYSAINRMLAEEMELQQYYDEMVKFTASVSLLYQSAEYFALIEADIIESMPKPKEAVPPDYVGGCLNQYSVTSFQPYLDKLADNGKSISGKYTSVDGAEDSKPEYPTNRAIKLSALARIMSGLSDKYAMIKKKTDERVQTLKTAVEAIRERSLTVKLPPLVYCHTNELRLFRTEYCEFPVDVAVPEKEWKVSDPEWTPFNLITSGSSQNVKAVDAYDAEGRYIQIVHAKNTGLWISKTPTTLCYHPDRGIFFKKDCKFPVETDNPVSSWDIEVSEEEKLSSLLLSIPAGTRISPLFSTGGLTSTYGQLTYAELNKTRDGKHHEVRKEVGNITNYAQSVENDVMIYRKRVNDRRMNQGGATVDWDHLVKVQKIRFQSLIKGFDVTPSTSKTATAPVSGDAQEKTPATTSIRQMTAEEAMAEGKAEKTTPKD